MFIQSYANTTTGQTVRLPSARLCTQHNVEARYTSGDTPTNYRYTGQLSQMDSIGLYFYQSRFYDPALSHFVSPDSIVSNLYNPGDWNRYSYVRYNPIKFFDPTGHTSACGFSYSDPECEGLSIVQRPKTEPPPEEPSTDLLSQLLGNESNNKDNTMPFDPNLGSKPGNEEYDPRLKEDPSNDRPSVAVLIAIGIPLTVAIILVEAGITYAEIQIGLITLAQPQLAPVTIPLELLLTGTSIALINIDIAYWAYTYRVAFTPKDEPVKFEALPPWDFGKQ